MNWRRAVWAANLLLAGLLAWAVATPLGGAEGELRLPAFVPEVKPPDAPPAPRARRFRPADCAAVFRRNIFGAMLREEATSAPEDVPLQKSTARPAPPLAVTVLGTVAGDSDVSRAILADRRTAAQNVYCCGDTIQGARIVAIGRAKVVVLHRGARRTLRLAGGKAGGQGASGGSRVAARQESSPCPGGTTEPTKALFARLRRIESTLETADLAAHRVEGRIRGMEVRDLDYARLRDALELEAGDVILAINGRAPTSVCTARRLLRSAERARRLNVKLLRGGRRLLFSYRAQG